MNIGYQICACHGCLEMVIGEPNTYCDDCRRAGCGEPRCVGQSETECLVERCPDCDRGLDGGGGVAVSTHRARNIPAWSRPGLIVVGLVIIVYISIAAVVNEAVEIMKAGLHGR